MKIWIRLVSDAVRHRRHWPALWRAHSAIGAADAAFAELARQGRIG